MRFLYNLLKDNNKSEKYNDNLSIITKYFCEYISININQKCSNCLKITNNSKFIFNEGQINSIAHLCCINCEEIVIKSGNYHCKFCDKEHKSNRLHNK